MNYFIKFRKTLLIGLITIFFFVNACSSNESHSSGSREVVLWTLSVIPGVDKYEFNDQNNTAILYFDEQNAKKIWFKCFKKNKDAPKKMQVKTIRDYMVNGWIYSDEVYGKENWPCFIYKGAEKYVFDYRGNTVVHYFDPNNAERIWFNSIQDPQNNVIRMQNVRKVENYIVDGWQYNGSCGDNNWPLSISKSDESYVFDYQNNTAIHSWNNSQNAEKLQFKTIQDPQKDALEKRNVISVIKLLENGWSLDGSVGNKHWPQTMTKGSETVKFDYQNKSATLYKNNKEMSKIWFSHFTDPVVDWINQNNIVYVKKPAENGWTYSGSYGKYEYPTSMSKGTEKFEFEYKNGCTAYHFVDGRRKEALEFNTFQSPMDVINKRSEAKIREYEFDYQGRLYRVKYLSKFGNYYLPFYIGPEGKEEISSTFIYKKGSGFVDDVAIEASLMEKSSMFDIIFSSDVYAVYQIDNRTGVKNKIAEVSPSQLKAYLLNILYNLEGS